MIVTPFAQVGATAVLCPGGDTARTQHRPGCPGGVCPTPAPSRPPGPGQPPHRPQQPDPPAGPRWHQVSQPGGREGEDVTRVGTPTHGKRGGTAVGVSATQPPVFHRRGSSSSLPSGSKASLSGECRGDGGGDILGRAGCPCVPRVCPAVPRGVQQPLPSRGRAAALPFGIHVWFSAAPPARPPFAAVEKLRLTSNLPLIKARRRAGPRGSPAAPGAGCHPTGQRGTPRAGAATPWGQRHGAEPRCPGMLDPDPCVPPCPPPPYSGGGVTPRAREPPGSVWHQPPCAGWPRRWQVPCQAGGCPQQKMPTRSSRGRPWRSWIGAWTSWRRCRPGTRSARWPPTR